VVERARSARLPGSATRFNVFHPEAEPRIDGSRSAIWAAPKQRAPFGAYGSDAVATGRGRPGSSDSLQDSATCTARPRQDTGSHPSATCLSPLSHGTPIVTKFYISSYCSPRPIVVHSAPLSDGRGFDTCHTSRNGSTDLRHSDRGQVRAVPGRESPSPRPRVIDQSSDALAAPSLAGPPDPSSRLRIESVPPFAPAGPQQGVAPTPNRRHPSVRHVSPRAPPFAGKRLRPLALRRQAVGPPGFRCFCRNVTL